MNHAPVHDVSHRAALAPVHDVAAASASASISRSGACLFVLSAMSYAVDYFHVQGVVRWVLILTFMMLKAGLIVAIFMHMAWERLALIYAILVPPLALGTLVWLMLIESDYTFWTRILFFDAGA